MGADDGIEVFKARAQYMREILEKSQSITDSVITILGSFDDRLSTLEAAMRPTQVLITALTLRPFCLMCTLLARFMKKLISGS